MTAYIEQDAVTPAEWLRRADAEVKRQQRVKSMALRDYLNGGERKPFNDAAFNLAEARRWRTEARSALIAAVLAGEVE